jgi:hypothetical protein
MNLKDVGRNKAKDVFLKGEGHEGENSERNEVTLITFQV